jgi:SAM-dependent methyltransferase
MTPDQMSGVESSYYAYMGFDPEHIRKVRAHYAPMFDGHGPVLELACGQGEFLQLLAGRGTPAQGLDADLHMVSATRSLGLAAEPGDAAEFLHREPAPGPFGGVFCAHLLEHMAPGSAAHLLDGVRRVLRPGGVFVAVIPNLACYAVLTRDFWRDPTHVRPYDVALVEFLCTRAGLTVEATGTNPLDHPGPPPGTEADLVMESDDLSPKVAALVRDLPRRARPLGELVDELARRLAQAQFALHDLERAHRTLVWSMYEPNEVYVMARG